MSVCDKKILGGLWDWPDLPATYRPNSGRFRPQTHNRNFKNMGFFAFLRIFGDFFFQNDDLVQNRPKIIKNGFFQLLWILKFIFIYFWTHFGKLKFWFFGIFLRPKPSISTCLLQHGILKFIFIYFWTHFGKLKFWFFGIFLMPKPSISPCLL